MTGSAELQGRRVLVVEDEFLVAMDIELMLRELGCEVLGPIADLAGALQAAREEPLDLALLDVNIAGESVTAVAEALAERALPFVFCTGYEVENLPNRYPSAPTLTKPFQIADLQSAVQTAVTRGSGKS